jgi:RNA polymerase sigma-70 factor (ECF subfamily)
MERSLSLAETTCWTIVRGAAAGDGEDRTLFARRYEGVIRSYLAARWRSSPRREDLDDAVQDVFAECFRRGGVLDRADEDRQGGFRAFLFGVARNVALRIESRRGRDFAPIDPDELADPGTAPSRAFDRAWAVALLREAASKQEELARATGPEALRRVELLRLRFHDGLPIRAIAERWGTDPSLLHRDYARARREFHDALRLIVAFHQPGTPAEVDRACAGLLEIVG